MDKKKETSYHESKVLLSLDLDKYNNYNTINADLGSEKLMLVYDYCENKRPSDGECKEKISNDLSEITSPKETIVIASHNIDGVS